MIFLLHALPNRLVTRKPLIEKDFQMHKDCCLSVGNLIEYFS